MERAEEKDYLTVQEVSEDLGLSQLSVRSHIKAGRIKAVLPMGMNRLGYKIDRESYEKFRRLYRGEE